MPFTPPAAFDFLERALARNRLGHAYLITGPAGAGKRELANRLTRRLLGASEADPFSHPDAHIAEPESKSRRIVIEQIRELEHYLRMRSLLGGNKVGLIVDADRLQPNAANAFLKTLEEPPPGTHLLLISAQPEQVLETILSRCIEVPLNAPEEHGLTDRQSALLKACATFARQDREDLPAVFGLLRHFETLLGEARASIQEAADARLKKEEQHYKQTTGSAKDWLEEREEYYKSLVESRTIAVRNELLGTLERWWADVLRRQKGAPHLDLHDFSDATSVLAARYLPAEVLGKIAALDKLREHLSNPGVNEALALECAFLKVFAA
ncbi:MAG: hypothetical protein M3463_23610 [Verrucomicrobiota bacterium]|nr:hypothetical protein [Verrucomicrobiota bacterium]